MSPIHSVVPIADSSRWDITPLCGSTNASHVQEALNVLTHESLDKEDPDVLALFKAMRRSGER